MATAKDIDAPLTLELSDADVSPGAFVRSVKAFFDAIRILSSEVDDSIRWKVQVKQGSNLISAYPKGGYNIRSVSDVVATFDRGLDMIDALSVNAGDFPEDALDAIRDLAKVAVGSDDDLLMRVWTDRKPHTLNARTVAAIDDILIGAYSEYGSVTGKIETVSKRGGAKFVVYENRNPRAINCHVPEDKLHDIIQAFDKRAEVYGKIHYDKHGRPDRVSVDDVVVFPENGDLPTHGEVRGALKGLAS